MALCVGLFVVWARSRTERELTARVGRLLLLSVTVALVGALGEVSMIILEPCLFTGLYEYDPDLGFRVRAHYPTQGGLTNKFGFNDQDYPEHKSPGIFRILVVGDSFSWAGGRDGNYTTLLERRLESHYGYHKIDVINAGYPMTHTAEQLAMLKKYGLQYNPDLVILGFFVGNDFIDANPNRKRIVVNDTYIDINPLEEHRFLGYPIVPQSRLWLFLEQKCRIIAEQSKAAAESQSGPQRAGTTSPSRPGEATALTELRASVLPQAPPAPGDGLAGNATGPRPGLSSSPDGHGSLGGSGRRGSQGPPEEWKALFSEETFLGIERARLEFFKIGNPRKEMAQRKITYILKSIEEMNALLKLRNARFIVAIYPDEFQINKALLQKIFERYKLSEKSYDIRLAQNILKQYLESTRIEYIDFTDRFVAKAEEGDLYLLRDTHWNGAGNQLASDILFRHVINYLDNLEAAQGARAVDGSGARTGGLEAAL
jgi:hypothetical protein